VFEVLWADDPDQRAELRTHALAWLNAHPDHGWAYWVSVALGGWPRRHDKVRTAALTRLTAVRSSAHIASGRRDRGSGCRNRTC